jgi:hypothetical protein
METGNVKREHCTYEKNESCLLLAAIEPLTELRIVEVYEQRTEKEFIWICQKIATQYPYADKIHLILDNITLNL